MPFLIGFIIAIMVEPIIRFLMRKAKLSRKVSSIITLLVIISIIIALLFLGISTLIQEAIELIQNMNMYIDKIYSIGTNIIQSSKVESIKLPEEVNGLLQNSLKEFLQTVSVWVKNILTVVVNKITSLPIVGLYIMITLLATVFICMDRVYILDQLEHHLPKTWMKKISLHLKDIISSLGSLLKAEVILIAITFIEVLVGLFIMNFMGLNVAFPLIATLITGIVDALPILGAGSVLVPWAIFSAVNGDLNLAIALIILYIIVIVVRQVLEPKIVSNQLGVHPIFTLIAMYTGFKFTGFLGLIIGPIVMIILSNIFANLLEGGVFKVIFNKR